MERSSTDEYTSRAEYGGEIEGGRGLTADQKTRLRQVRATTGASARTRFHPLVYLPFNASYAYTAGGTRAYTHPPPPLVSHIFL